MTPQWTSRLSMVLLIVAATLVSVVIVQRQDLHATRALLATVGPAPLDVGFLQAMAVHHRQAITLSQVLLAGEASALSPLARSVVASQTLELGEMRGWLKLWAQPVEVLKPSMDWMLLATPSPSDDIRRYLLACQASPTGMSGLADDATVDAFRYLVGPARDAQYIALMLAHHRGGLPMARFAATHAMVPAVRALARQIVIDQAGEIDWLERARIAQQNAAR